MRFNSLSILHLYLREDQTTQRVVVWYQICIMVGGRRKLIFFIPNVLISHPTKIIQFWMVISLLWLAITSSTRLLHFSCRIDCKKPRKKNTFIFMSKDMQIGSLFFSRVSFLQDKAYGRTKQTTEHKQTLSHVCCIVSPQSEALEQRTRRFRDRAPIWECSMLMPFFNISSWLADIKTIRIHVPKPYLA